MQEKQPIAEFKSQLPFNLPPNLVVPALSVLITACNGLSPRNEPEAIWRIGYGTLSLGVGVFMIISAILLFRRNGPRK